MLQAIKIPKNMTRGQELVVISREEYNALLLDARYKQTLDRELTEALQEVKQKKTVGSFKTVQELRNSLEQ